MSEPKKPPTISAVITVYNKAPFLPATIRSLRRQADDERTVEYIFVDDASSDASLAIIKDLMAGAPNLRIIENTDNRGPSIRLNQGAAAASGDYLYLLDGDDLATLGAMSGMLERLDREGADFIYGRTAKQLSPDLDPFDLAADPSAPHRVSDNPLSTVLGGGCVRMALMCGRDLFMRAGGADERIFVQDESLPLRLAAKAARMIVWEAEVIGVQPPADGVEKISGNKSQLHHDAFFAYRNALDDFGTSDPALATKLYAKAVSAYWKHARRQRGAAILQSAFWRYLESKNPVVGPRPAVLAWMAEELHRLSGIRRCG